MAEKQCNLIKNGGGTDEIMLRATITNTTSQTWRQVLNQVYSALSSAVANDKDKIANAKLVMKQPNQISTYYITLEDFNAHNFQFMRIVGATTIVYFGFIIVEQNNSSVLSPYIQSNGSAGIGDESNAACPFTSVELWY